MVFAEQISNIKKKKLARLYRIFQLGMFFVNFDFCVFISSQNMYYVEFLIGSFLAKSNPSSLRRAISPTQDCSHKLKVSEPHTSGNRMMYLYYCKSVKEAKEIKDKVCFCSSLRRCSCEYVLPADNNLNYFHCLTEELVLLLQYRSFLWH